MTHTYFDEKKGLASAQPPQTRSVENAPDLFGMDRNAYFINIPDVPFGVRLSHQIGIVVDRLDIREPLQACVKSCSTQAQTSSSLFCCKHSFFLHRWDILIRLIILIDKTNVKPYNTNWTSKTKRTSCHSQIIAMKRLLSKYQEVSYAD